MFKKNKLQIIFITLIVAIFSGICVAEEKLLRDTWYLIELDGKPVGYSFVQFFQVEDGYIYDLDQMSTVGHREIQHTKWKVNQDFEIQSIESTKKSSREQSKAEAKFNNGTFVIISTDENGDQLNIPWEPKEKIFFSDSFLDYLLLTEDFQIKNRYVAKCWDPFPNRPQYSTFWIEEAPIEYNGKTFSGFKIMVNGYRLIIVDHSGEIYRSEDMNKSVVIRKVEKDEIFYFKCLALDLLLVPGNKQITHPYRSTNSQIRVRWRDVADDQFNWIDNRQKLVTNTQSDGTYEVLLTIEKDKRDFTNQVKLPVTDEEFLPYLTDTEFVHPSIPEVKELIKETIGSEDDGWTATQKLVKWVHNFLSYEPLILTLTTEKILDRKSGNCVEYAVLFASLARSVGLPTRFVLGERYEANNWTGHIWNEVWLGEWVAVDPSHKQISPDALLLKFVDSDSVMGTQIVRRGLIGQLDIEIIDAKFSAKDDIILHTGVIDRTYSNAYCQCQITCPKNWKFDQQSFMKVTMRPVNMQGVHVALSMFNFFNEPTSQHLLEREIADLKDKYSEFTMIDQQNALLANKPALCATWTIVNRGIPIRQQKWILFDEEQFYDLTFTTVDTLWDDYQIYFQEILDSFRIID